ncbi:OmpA family protein [Spirosoma areae]
MNKLLFILAFIALGSASKRSIISVKKLIKQPFSEQLSRNITESEEPFTVGFALNSSQLSQKGRKVIKLAAATIANQGATRVLVVGHTDQIGSPEYNLRLSRRRTETVIQRLQYEGVSPTILSADWKGEFDPKVPGGEDSVEPQNRRVVIQVFF